MLSLFVVAAALSAAHGSQSEAAAAPPSSVEVRGAVERSIVFLDKSGNDWWTKSKCASCHHVPMSVWSMTEAQNRGLAVDKASLEQLREWAVTSYDKHPKLKPVGQDGEEKGLSLNTIYLLQAAAPAAKLDDATTAALKKFAAHLIAAQHADGSWESSAKLPPVGDDTEARTMQVLLALDGAAGRGFVESAAWTAARDKALAWLRGRKLLERNQSLNLQLLVAARFGKPAEVAMLSERLLSQQEPDGGWSQTKELPPKDLKEYEEDEKKGTDGKAAPKPHLEKNTAEKPAAGKNEQKPDAKEASKPAEPPAAPKPRGSDALATGQTLYALVATGTGATSPAVRRAQAYLLKTQTKDGSWLVPFRAQKNSGRALSHYGTGWAAIGLMQTLPPAKASGAATTAAK